MTYRPLIMVALYCLVASPALAADGAPVVQPWTLTGEVGVVSDYRFRGLSLSDEKPALQGGLTVTHASGAYGYVWGSTIDEYGAGADGRGAKAEVDLVMGWAGSIGGLDVDASAQAYVYPGGTDVNYVEFPVSASKTLEAWKWSLGGSYAPAQKALGDQDNIYGWGAVAWADARFPLKAELRAGYEDGAYAPGGKWDWSAGISHDFGPLGAGVNYVDSDASSAGVVASITATF